MTCEFTKLDNISPNLRSKKGKKYRTYFLEKMTQDVKCFRPFDDLARNISNAVLFEQKYLCLLLIIAIYKDTLRPPTLALFFS